MDSLLLRAAKLHEEGLALWFPVDGEPYAAIEPRQPEDATLILHPLAFNPFIPDEDLDQDEDGEVIFWSFGKIHQG